MKRDDEGLDVENDFAVKFIPCYVFENIFDIIGQDLKIMLKLFFQPI